MSRAEELKAKAAQAAARRRERGAAGTGVPTSMDTGAGRTEEDRKLALAPAAPHVKPIRSTVDLAPVRHNQLKIWCQETAVELGKSRVTTQDVVRAMVTRLLSDEVFARKIRDDLRSEND